MNSTPISPNDFMSEGAYVGNLFDFVKEDEIEKLKSVIEDIKQYSIDNRETKLRCRYNHNGQEDEGYHYEHAIPLSEIAERDQFIIDHGLVATQKWLEFNGNSTDVEYFMKICEKINNALYPQIEMNTSLMGGFTLYEDGHFICDHKDGNNPGRVCVIIIYLTDESEYNDGGGELIIKTNSQKEYTIKPVLGTFSVLDFSKSDVHHAVNKVKNGFKRYSFINFFYQKLNVL